MSGIPGIDSAHSRQPLGSEGAAPTDLVNNFIALESGELLSAVDNRVGVQFDADVLGQLIHIQRSAQTLEECHEL